MGGRSGGLLLANALEGSIKVWGKCTRTLVQHPLFDDDKYNETEAKY